MPSANRFASLRDTVRNHPVIVATTAATGGVLLGGFVVGSAVCAAETADPATAAPRQGGATGRRSQTPKPAAETTGSAPAGESVASADCDQQTWPHLSRVCMEEYRSKNRSARVVSTDKLDKPTVTAIEAQPPARR